MRDSASREWIWKVYRVCGGYKGIAKAVGVEVFLVRAWFYKRCRIRAGCAYRMARVYLSHYPHTTTLAMKAVYRGFRGLVNEAHQADLMLYDRCAEYDMAALSNTAPFTGVNSAGRKR